MNNTINHAAGWPHPRVPNHINNDPTPKDQAIYVPSVSPSHAQMIYAGKWPRPLPSGIAATDLNFLDPNNKLFRISHAMTSAGQALKHTKPCIITERDRSNTMVIADSGGYQIASDRLKINGDKDRSRILKWIESVADIAMTLDVPTGPVAKSQGNYLYSSSGECLTATLEHLDYFQRNRVPGKVRFLNVLQGNTPDEADTWYNAVKRYDFEGWAFAGVLRHNLYELCRRLLIMANENQLQKRLGFTFWGRTRLDTAVLLTALQRAINRHINPDLRISFDTSTPYRMLSFNQMFTLPTFESNRMVMGILPVPVDGKFRGSPLPWPWPSPIGNLMNMGDYCVTGSLVSGQFRDRLSEVLLAHHNLGALCWAISTANRVFDVYSYNHKYNIGQPQGSAVEIIDRVFKSGKLADLQSFRGTTFDRLRHAQTYDDGENNRYWDDLR